MTTLPRNIPGSILFNVIFYSVTFVLCFSYLPLLLLPRPWFLGAVRFYLNIVYGLEKYLLGLDYEVRGIENLPTRGSYIIAAKHQSQYETFKLHFLFRDPAIILKRELIAIPLFGWYLNKTDVIAIDRSTPEKAIESIQDGARRMQAQGRPILIFPQGTRVSPHETAQEKPYKVGVARIQESTGLPIIPMAMNAGLFWPKRGFFKSSGKVIFEFLEPIPSGMDRAALLKILEERIEEKSNALMSESLNSCL